MIKRDNVQRLRKLGNKVWLEGNKSQAPTIVETITRSDMDLQGSSQKILPRRYQIGPEPLGESTTGSCLPPTPYKETEETEQTSSNRLPNYRGRGRHGEVETDPREAPLRRGKKKLQSLVRWKDYAPAHDQWVEQVEIRRQPNNNIERENREERPSRRDIRNGGKQEKRKCMRRHPSLHFYNSQQLS